MGDENTNMRRLEVIPLGDNGKPILFVQGIFLEYTPKHSTKIL